MTLTSATIVVVVLRLCKGLVESLSPVMLRQLEVVDKATALAAASDVQAFQGIQVMDQAAVGYPGETYDPSDEAQARAEAERDGIDYEEMTRGNNDELYRLFD